MLSSAERQSKALVDDWFCVALDYKIEWERELHRQEILAITGLPDPLPHPDQVKIGMDTGMARIEAELKRAWKPKRIGADKKQVERVLETIGTALGMLDWRR